MTEVTEMADRPRPERRDRQVTPLWVKLFGVAALVVVLLLAVVMVAGGGGHGPGQHTGLAGAATASASFHVTRA